MSGQLNRRNDPAEIERSMRSLEAAVDKLGEKVMQSRDLLVAARKQQTERFEAVIREVIADALEQIDGALPPCHRCELCPQSTPGRK